MGANAAEASAVPQGHRPPPVGSQVTWVHSGLRFVGHVIGSTQSKVDMVVDDVSIDAAAGQTFFDLGCVHWERCQLEIAKPRPTMDAVTEFRAYAARCDDAGMVYYADQYPADSNEFIRLALAMADALDRKA